MTPFNLDGALQAAVERHERQKIEAREVLAEAAEYIAVHGWHQGNYRSQSGSVCALGAIWSTKDKIITDEELYGDAQFLAHSEVCDIALELLGCHVEKISGSRHVPNWNDMPDRTAEDVILAMKRTAAGE